MRVSFFFLSCVFCLVAAVEQASSERKVAAAREDGTVRIAALEDLVRRLGGAALGIAATAARGSATATPMQRGLGPIPSMQPAGSGMQTGGGASPGSKGGASTAAGGVAGPQGGQSSAAAESARLGLECVALQRAVSRLKGEVGYLGVQLADREQELMEVR